MAEQDPVELAERVRVLEAENAALSRDLGRRGPRTHGRARGFWSVTCIVIASILVPVSIASAWARGQLVDESVFVETLAPLVHEADVQELIVDEAMAAVQAQVDFENLTDVVFDGVIELGIGDRVAGALDLLRQPAAEGLAHVARSSITTAVESQAFADLWEVALRGAHRTLTVAATSDGGGIIVLDDDGLGLALGPLIEGVKEVLTEQGVAVATFIPVVDRTVIIGDGQSLGTLRAAHYAVALIGWWLPVLTLGLFGLGIALARRRGRAVAGSGLGLALGAGSLGVALAMGSVIVMSIAEQSGVSPDALDAIFAHVVEGMRGTIGVVVVVGIIAVIGGWLAGSSRVARRVRGAGGAVDSTVRGALRSRGLDTGRFGSWLARWRIPVRVTIVVLAVVGLLVIPSPGIGGVVLGAVLVGILLWILALLEQRPEESATHATEATDAVGATPGISP